MYDGSGSDGRCSIYSSNAGKLCEVDDVDFDVLVINFEKYIFNT